jgi:hypothetical protein
MPDGMHSLLFALEGPGENPGPFIYQRIIMFICRLTAPGWENFTGSMGHGAVFENGVSVAPLNARQIARIGASTKLVNEETGEQVGPSVMHNFIQGRELTVAPQLKTARQEQKDFEFDREKLAAEEQQRKEQEAQALAEAHRKALQQVADAIVYTRAELEAIAANNGISGMRAIATPLGVRGRGISELIEEILAAQAKLASE